MSAAHKAVAGQSRPCGHTRVHHEHGTYNRAHLDGCRCRACTRAHRRRRTARGGRRRTDSPRRKPARRPVRRRAAAAAGTTTRKPRVEPAETERVERAARVESRAPVRLGPVPRRRPPFEAPTGPVLRGYASDHGLPANPAAARYAAARRRAQSLTPTSSASSEGFFS